jgi:hypothetical protein
MPWASSACTLSILSCRTWQRRTIGRRYASYYCDAHAVLTSRQTGCYYSRPPIRCRPKYRCLAEDGQIERGVVDKDGKEQRVECNKYYQMYHKSGLTGGLMALWCRHSVCLGFHCIPRGEGRNDVFSALYTRWKKPPRNVIYDFGCALAPYCMLREPEFFKDTRFLIDGFHGTGHSRCSDACKISNYSRYDPDLVAFNSSAAECGNAGLLRIRKSLRYMTQAHAILYTAVFLAIWNRVRRIKLARAV